MSRHEELRTLGVGAARDARVILAEAANALDPSHGEVAQAIAAIVGGLFAAELTDARGVHEALERAMGALRTQLETHMQHEALARPLSRALAILHPAQTELARTFAPNADEPVEPAPRWRESEPPGEDRRADERLILEVDVGLEGDHTFFTGRTGDLSRGGLFVATDEPLPVGTDVVLAFVLPDGHRVTAEALVAWVRAPRYRLNELPAGMGVRFLELAPADQHAIEHFLRVKPAFRHGD